MVFNKNTIFGKTVISIPKDCEIVFVSDYFLEDLSGGAELTTDALIQSSPLKIFKLHSKDLTISLLSEGHQKFWIFGNFSGIDYNLIPSIVANMKYSIIEYDYKYCKYRSPEKHESIENKKCDCHEQMHGKIISAFYHGAKSLWWMSEKQLKTYIDLFPFLDTDKNTVLSSVFDDKFFASIKILRENQIKTNKWIILGSTSWIKGTEEAENWCKENNHESTTLWNVSYEKMLSSLSEAEGLCFLPKGGDTCPRVVIEAKLLNCKLHINENVQHAKEIWFDTNDLLDTESYLYMSRQRFWNGIRHDMTYIPKISGYTTTYNCISQDYPFEESIKSMLGFCSEVIVVDGGSTDGTWEKLEELAACNSIYIEKVAKNWNDERFAVFDGEQKAYARTLCTQPICWQQDSDEIIHEDDYEKIRILARDLPNTIQLLSLPVIEYWGGKTKVRMDINPLKWRMSRNYKNITHGIPKQLQCYDKNGKLFAKQGTDGCDYIDNKTFECIPNSTFYTQDIDNLKNIGVFDDDAKNQYQHWFQSITDSLPSVHHYSWFDINRKIKTYKNYWSKHWLSLYDIAQNDSPENNMFFDKSWSLVTDDEITNLATRLSMEMGGWIFHKKIDFSRPTNYVTINKTHPAIMSKWLLNHSFKMTEGIDELESKLKSLISVKGNDNWQSVRNPLNNFELVEKEFPFGKRKTFVLKTSKENYENLQQSRGLTIQTNDTINSFIERSIDDMSVLSDSDLLRTREILEWLGAAPEVFGEVGFRLPRLQHYFACRGTKKSIGVDIADISLILGKGLGFNVAKYDLNECKELLPIQDCDLVVSYHALEHVSDPFEAVKMIYKSMKNNAIFHVEIPIETDIPNIQVAHVYPFNPGDLAKMLNLAGFNIVNMSTRGHMGASQIERCIAVKNE